MNLYKPTQELIIYTIEQFCLTNTIHVVKWIVNGITPMLRLVNANNLIFSLSYYVNKQGRGEILTM